MSNMKTYVLLGLLATFIFVISAEEANLDNDESIDEMKVDDLQDPAGEVREEKVSEETERYSNNFCRKSGRTCGKTTPKPETQA